MLIVMVLSFSMLWGVKSHIKHLLNVSRLPFTFTYFFTLFPMEKFQVEMSYMSRRKVQCESRLIDFTCHEFNDAFNSESNFLAKLIKFTKNE